MFLQHRSSLAVICAQDAHPVSGKQAFGRETRKKLSMHFARKHHKSLFSTGADSRNHIHTKVGVRFSQPPAFALSAPKSYHDHNPSEHSLYRQNQYLPPCFLARFLPPAEPPPQTASPDTDSIPGPRITKVKRLSLSTRGGGDQTRHPAV